MDSIFSKFGIFDFLGIWWPGAITLFYFDLTLHDWFATLLDNGILFLPSFGELYAFLALYIAGGYLIGVILHELGKLLFELTEHFRPERVVSLPSIAPWPIRFPAKKLHDDHEKALQLSSIPVAMRTAYTFHHARAELKYGNTHSSERCEKYHSIYAFSRSMMCCFALHCTITLLIHLFRGSALIEFIWLLLIDCLLTFLFLFRSYRYYIVWVRNTIIQYSVISNLKATSRESKQHERPL